MPPRTTKKKSTKKAPTTDDGDPSKVVDKVETDTPIVTETPNIPEDKTPEEEPKKRRRRKSKMTEEEAAKLESDKMIAGMLVDMQLGLTVKVGGDLWEAEDAERQALIGAYQRFLGRFAEMPWWVELSLAQAAYFGPRIVLMRMMAAANATDTGLDPVDLPTEAPQPHNNGGTLVGGLDPAPKKK